MQIENRFIRITLTSIWYVFAVGMVMFALAVSLARMLTPVMSEEREAIESLISEYAGQKIRISGMEAQWRGLGPNIVLKDVQIFDQSGDRRILQFEEAQIGLGVYESLRAQQFIPTSLKVIGVSIAFTRKLDGSLNIRGISESGSRETTEYSDLLAQWLLEQRRLAIEDGEIFWNDEITGVKDLRFRDVDIAIRNNIDRHQLDGSVVLPDNLGKKIQFAVDLQGNLLDPLDWQASAFVSGKAFQFAEWLGGTSLGDISVQDGVTDFSIWADWANGNISRVEGDFATDNMQVTINSLQRELAYESARGVALWARSRTGWSMHVKQLDLQQPQQSLLDNEFYVTFGDSGKTLDAEFRYLPVNEVTALLLSGELLEDNVATALKEIQPSGLLGNVRLHYQADATAAEKFSIQADFNNLQVRSWDTFPAMSGLTGTLQTSLTQGSMTLDSQNIGIHYAPLFDQDTPLEKIRGKVSWSKQGSEWYVASDKIDIENEGISLRSRFALSIPEQGGSPYVELVSKFDGADGRVALKYLPTRVMDADVTEWLEHAIIGGQVPDGGLILRGKLDEFPFDKHQGKFETRMSVRNAELDYVPDWPKITGIDAELLFLGRSLTLSASAGKIFDSQVTNADVAIADMSLDTPILTLQGSMNGYVKDALDFVRITGIAESYGNAFKRINAKGRSVLKLDLKVPLDESEVTVKGALQMRDSVFGLKDIGVKLENINGTLNFSEVNVSAKKLQGEILGKPIDINLKPRKKASNDEADYLRFIAETQIDTDLLTQFTGLKLDKIIAGQTTGKITIDVPEDPDTSKTLIQFISDLEGLAVSLPAPLGKSEGMLRPIQFKSELVNLKPNTIWMNFNDQMSANIDVAENDQQQIDIKRAHLHFGSDVPELFHDEGIVVTGKLASLVVNDWLDLSIPPASPEKAVTKQQSLLDKLVTTNLEIEQMIVNRRVITNAILTTEREEKGLRVGIKSAQATGTILLPDQLASQPVVANFDNLEYSPLQDSYDSNADPRNWPALDVTVKNLKYDGYDVGEVTAQVSKIQEGLYLDSLNVQSRHFELSGSGDWRFHEGDNLTRLSLQLNSEDMGKALESFDYGDTLAGGRVETNMQLQWEDAPDAIAFEKISGDMKLDIREGRLLDVKAGAGRVFGLLSLQTLPRRLLLDFSDLFAKGFSFDTVNGNFSIDEGDAFTTGLNMEGPSAQITISGRTGLAEEDYDQLVTVVPKVTASLPVAGAIAGGPIAGGLLFAFDKLFKKQIDNITRFQYTITGSWEDPVVEPLEKINTPSTVSENEEG